MKQPLKHFWLVVSTPLKHISQIGSFPQIGVKIKNVWNHHLDLSCIFISTGIIRFWNNHMKASAFRGRLIYTSFQGLFFPFCFLAFLILSFVRKSEAQSWNQPILQGFQHLMPSTRIQPGPTTPIVPASKPQDASDKLQPLKSSPRLSTPQKKQKNQRVKCHPLFSIILEALSYREANNPENSDPGFCSSVSFLAPLASRCHLRGFWKKDPGDPGVFRWMDGPSAGMDLFQPKRNLAKVNTPFRVQVRGCESGGIRNAPGGNVATNVWGFASHIKCGWRRALSCLGFPSKKKLYSLSVCGLQAMYHSHQTTKNKL